MAQRLPYDANPDRLVELCVYLGDRQLKMSEIYADDDFDTSQTVVQRNVDFGKRTGFLSVTSDEEVSNAGYGRSLASAGSINSTTEWLFEEAIKQYQPYAEVISALIRPGSTSDIDGEECVTQQDVEDVLEERFSMSDRVRTGAARTLMRVIDAAGLGNYKRGRKGKPTRVVLLPEIDKYRPEETRPQQTDDETEETTSLQDEEEEPELAENKGGVSVSVSGFVNFGNYKEEETVSRIETFLAELEESEVAEERFELNVRSS